MKNVPPKRAAFFVATSLSSKQERLDIDSPETERTEIKIQRALLQLQTAFTSFQHKRGKVCAKVGINSCNLHLTRSFHHSAQPWVRAEECDRECACNRRRKREK
jgi:hypothetical protein